MTMAHPVQASNKSGPIVPPRRKSSLFMRENPNHDRLDLPACRHLIVTTTRGVFTWGSHGVKEIFHSGSGGIVAARKARNGSSLLAVADSQVVILHDTRKGMQKSYKLRGSDVRSQLCESISKMLINPGATSATSICRGFKEPLLHHYTSKRSANLLFARIKTPGSFSQSSFASYCVCYLFRFPIIALCFSCTTNDSLDQLII